MDIDVSDILFVGIGQAGNNLVSAVRKENESINGFLINTSEKDFARIRNVPDVCKYAIPLASGTGKDREKAKDFVEEYVKTIYDKITAFKCKTVFFAFSMGGGSGSGMTPYIISMLHEFGYMNDRVVNIVPMMPFKHEDSVIQQNAIECWNEIVDKETGILNCINSIYLIDNNKREKKLEVNHEFARLFNQFLDITDEHPEEVLDGSEIQLLMECHGLSGIYEFDELAEDIEEEFANAIEDSIFVVNSKTFERLGMSAPADFDMRDASKMFTTSSNGLYGISDSKAPMLMLSGAVPNISAVKGIKEELERKLKEINRRTREVSKQEVSATVDISDIVPKKRQTRSAKKEVSIDDALKNREELWSKLRHRK